MATATEATGQDAYTRMLYAVGNNHAGSYFPVVLAVVPFLGEILAEGSDVACARTLDVLIDLVGSFDPEQGHELIDTVAGPRRLSDELLAEARKLIPVVEAARCRVRSTEESRLARELLDLLEG